MKRARWIGIVLILVCIGMFLFITDYVGAVVAVCGASVLGISFLCSVLGRFGIKLFLHTVQIEDADQPISFRVDVKNRSVFPSGWLRICVEVKNLFTEEWETQRVVIPLNVRADAIVDFSKLYARCGVCEIRMRSAVIYGFFGLIPIPCRKPSNGRTTRLPALLPVDIERVSLPMYEELEAPANGVSTLRTDMIGVHEYLPGDSMRDIHWKLSVRTNNLFVREYAAPRIANLCLIAVNDLVDGTAEEIERWASVLHTLASLLIVHRVSFTVMYLDAAGLQKYQRIDSASDWGQAMHEILSVPMHREKVDDTPVKDNDFTGTYSIAVLADSEQLGHWIGKNNTDILLIGTLPHTKYAEGQRVLSIQTTVPEEVKRAFAALLMEEGNR